MIKQKKSSVKKDITRRVNLSFALILIFALAIVVKAASTQIKDGEQLRLRATESFSKTDTLYPERGNIYTEDGRMLSSTIPRFNLKMDLTVINKDTFFNYLDTISVALSSIFGDESPNAIRQRMKIAYSGKKSKYWTLKDNVAYFQFQKVRELPIFNKPKNKGGFLPEPMVKRTNPYGRLAARTIGLWRDNAQTVGLENSYDTALSGEKGMRIMHKIGGIWVPVVGSEVEAEHGKDIVSTIDIDVQEVAEHALHDVMAKYECLQGTAIVMEVSTGKIKALANLGRQADGTYWEDYNYALMRSEPGSVFKLMSLYALMEDGIVDANSMVNCYGGAYTFGNRTVRDDHGGLGTITIENAFAQSSNVAFATLVAHNYSKSPMKFIKHLQNLGLDKKVGIDVPGEQNPVIKTTSSKDWNKVTSLPWMAFGYVSMITPLHTCMVYNGIANNGKMMKPYLVSSIKDDGKVIKDIQPTVLIEKMGKESTIKGLQQVTRAVVEKGTAKAAQSPFYHSGGKTGTAQVHDKIADVQYTYSDGVRQGSFVGYFPAENPKYTIAVLIRSKPNGTYYGSVLGVPVFKAIADKLYTTKVGGWKLNVDSLSRNKQVIAKAAPNYQLNELLNFFGHSVKETNSRAIASVLQLDQNNKLTLVPKVLETSTVPDVVGMGMKEALYLLENAGMKVAIKGVGTVVSQSIPAGSKIVNKQLINIELS